MMRLSIKIFENNIAQYKNGYALSSPLLSNVLFSRCIYYKNDSVPVAITEKPIRQRIHF